MVYIPDKQININVKNIGLNMNQFWKHQKN
jgi:hypothetical protein